MRPTLLRCFLLSLKRLCSHVRAIDLQLDRIQLSAQPKLGQEQQLEAIDAINASSINSSTKRVHHDQRLQRLLSHINALTLTSQAVPTLISTSSLLQILQHALPRQVLRSPGIDGIDEIENAATLKIDEYERDLEWILLAKATTQIYGRALDAMIQGTVPLHDEIWYWKDVQTSYRYTGLYSLQTSPLRLWQWSRTVLHEVNARGDYISAGWARFYHQVRSVVRDLSIATVQRSVTNPLVLVRAEMCQKQTSLERAHRLYASGIGYLLSNGMNSEK